MRYATEEPSSFFAESIRAIRLSIQRALRIKPVQVVLVTSAIDNEGKTTVAVNLALSLAALGIRTLLVGSITPAGAGYTVSVRAIDPVPGTVIAEVTETAADKSRVLEAVGALSAKVRTALGDATPQSAMAAQQETFTTSSLAPRSSKQPRTKRATWWHT